MKKIWYPKNYLNNASKGSKTREPIPIFQWIKIRKEEKNFERLLAELKSDYLNDLKIGASIKTGDCFFDAFSQGLNELNIKPSYHFTAKSLRKDCREYAYDNQGTWVYNAVIEDAKVGGYFVSSKGEYEDILEDEKGGNKIDGPQSFDKYLGEIENMSGEGKDIDLAIRGRLNIEGKMICEKYQVKIEVIELTEMAVLHRDNQYNKKSEEGEGVNVIRMLNYKQYFVPLLKNLQKDITENIQVSRKEIYGEENVVHKQSENQQKLGLWRKFLNWLFIVFNKLRLSSNQNPPGEGLHCGLKTQDQNSPFLIEPTYLNKTKSPSPEAAAKRYFDQHRTTFKP